jgi:hypothetical protein
MTELFTGLSALAALAAAVAAWRSARASEHGSALAQRAALLGSIPILVPWVEAESTTLKVLNRGSSDAHETRWYLIQGERVKAEGAQSRIIPKGQPSDLTDPQNGVLAGLLRSSEFVARCEYLTSWGEALRVDRMYRDGRSAGIELRNAKGEVLRIAH